MARRIDPAVSPRRIYDNLHVLDFGPLYRAEDSSGGIVREPPKVSSGSYGILEIQVDADGNDLARIRSVFLQTPIGTYTGWNLGRKDRFENGMYNLQGSFIPFASTKVVRPAVGDPRLSIEERFPTKDAYLAAFRKAADDLVANAFCFPTMRTRWSRPPRSRAFGTLLRGRLQGRPVLRCRR
jgi:hypothetical protein